MPTQDLVLIVVPMKGFENCVWAGSRDHNEAGGGRENQHCSTVLRREPNLPEVSSFRMHHELCELVDPKLMRMWIGYI